MFDNLRDQADTDPGYPLDSMGMEEASAGDASPVGFLGMTARQRLIIAVMLLIAVCVLGTTCLLVTGAIQI
jgi:hypothetical protein